MGRLITVCLMLYAVLCYFQVQGADKYTDENRPYEFGFTIDGEQHRHEKKDENGIIMGEFGFITADGVYHVTVYATDENGNFKIISMKNIRVKPYPTAPDTRSSAERKGHSLPFAATQQLSTPHSATNTQQAKHESSSSLRACSHCKLPTTTTPRPKLASSTVLSNDNYNKQFQIAGNAQLAGNSQKTSQNYNDQYDNTLARQQPGQPNLVQNYQQESISAQSHQNIPSHGQSYPNQAVNVISQERFSQNVPTQQNYPQDEFNVGRKYLQKSKSQQNYQQQPSRGPNSLVQSDVGTNHYQQGFNVELQQQQGIFDGQYNLQPPSANRYDQQVSIPASYPQQVGAKVQNFGTPILGQNYPSSNAEQNYVQGSNANGNKYINNEIYQNQPKNPSQTIATSIQETTQGDRQPKTFTDILQMVNLQQQYKSTGTPSNSYSSSQQNIEKPVLVAAQMQVVNKNTDIYHKNPGETEGLPKGLTQADMTELLYTFNYTVGFHSHHEEGYRSGAKIGYYYVTGRNGIRTRVDYVADETGFHPRISQEVFDIQSEDVPKPETEKDEKYGLKGYEFKWLYYPIDSK